MANLKSSVIRKLKKVLRQRFPAPATVELDDLDGIIGVITSPEFTTMETIDRQDLMGHTIEPHLTLEERRQIQIIVGITPDDGDAYLPSPDR